MRTDDREIGLVCAGDALARRCKDIGPGILHRHQVIPAVRIGNGEDDRLLRQIEPRRRRQHVGIRIRGIGLRSIGKRALVRKRIRRHLGRRDLPRDVHQHQRVRVDIDLLREPFHLLVYRRRDNERRDGLGWRRLGTAGRQQSAHEHHAGNEKSGHARHGDHLRAPLFFAS